MSRRRRPGPAGRKVASGHLRVDAARAVAKLREYQLSNPADWILEVIRAITARGATAITVGADSNDVWVSWQGETFTPASLTNLFDALVNSNAKEPGLRAMAVGINSALGKAASRVDVYSLHRSGEELVSERVRYGNELLKGGDQLRELTAEPTPPDKDAIEHFPYESGGLVHFRRASIWEAVSIFTTSAGSPPEIARLHSHCRDPRVPVSLPGGVTLTVEDLDHDLLRVPVQLGEGCRGFLAIESSNTSDRVGAGATLVFAEQGVVIEEMHFEPLKDKKLQARTSVPIRLVIDADSLPTNASRSASRADHASVQNWRHTVENRIPALLDALAEPESEELRNAAVNVVAAYIGGPDWAKAVPVLADGPLGKLLRAKIVKDGIGRERSLLELSDGPSSMPAFVSEGIFGEEHEEFVGNLLLVHPDGPERFITGGTGGLATDKELLPRSKRYLEARDRFYGQEPDASLGMESPDFRFAPGDAIPTKKNGSFFVDDSPFRVEDLEIRIRFVPDATMATYDFWQDNRHFTVLHEASDVGFVASVQCPALSVDYVDREMARDSVYGKVRAAVWELVLWKAQEMALALGEETASDHDALIFQHVLAQATRTPPTPGWRRLQYAIQNAKEDAPILHAKCFALVQSKTRGTVRASFKQIVKDARDSCVAIWPNRNISPPPGRPCLRVGELPAAKLVAIFDDQANVHEYSSSSKRAEPADLRVPPVSPAAWFDEGDRRMFLRLHPGKGTVQVFHRGEHVGSTSVDGTSSNVDDDLALPGHGFDVTGVVAAVHKARDRVFEAALLRALRLPNLDPLTLEMPKGVPDDDARKTLMLAAASYGEVPPTAKMAFEDAQWVPTLKAHTSIATLKTQPNILRLAPSQEVDVETPDDFDPVTVDKEWAGALGKLTGKQVKSADSATKRYRKASARQRARLKFLKGRKKHTSVHPDTEGVSAKHVFMDPGHPPLSLSILESPAPVTVRVRTGGANLIRVFRAEASGFPNMFVIAEVADGSVDSDYLGLSPQGHTALIKRVWDAAAAYVLELSQQHDLLRDSAPARRFVREWATRCAKNKTNKAVLQKLKDAPIFETVQGGCASLNAALRRTRVHIAKYDEAWVADGTVEDADRFEQAILRQENGEVSAFATRVGMAVSDETTEVLAFQAKARAAAGLGVVADFSLLDRKDLLHVASIDELAGRSKSIRARIGLGHVGLSRLSLRTVVTDAGASRPKPVELPDFGLPLHVVSDVPDSRGFADESSQARHLFEQALHSLALKYLEDLFKYLSATELPLAQRTVIRKYLLSRGRSGHEILKKQTLFETTASTWVTLEDLAAQQDTFGNIWCVSGQQGSAFIPVDDQRVAVRLDDEELEHLQRDFKAIEASKELAKDAQLRDNLARRVRLKLEPSAGLQKVAAGIRYLKGDGAKSPRGFVVALVPSQRNKASLALGREGLRICTLDAPGDWPVFASIEWDKLEPNRVHDNVEEGPALSKVLRLVEQVGREALQHPGTAAGATDAANEPFAVHVWEKHNGTRITGILYPAKDLLQPQLEVLSPTRVDREVPRQPLHTGRTVPIPMSGKLMALESVTAWTTMMKSYREALRRMAEAANKGSWDEKPSVLHDRINAHLIIGASMFAGASPRDFEAVFKEDPELLGFVQGPLRLSAFTELLNKRGEVGICEQGATPSRDDIPHVILGSNRRETERALQLVLEDRLTSHVDRKTKPRERRKPAPRKDNTGPLRGHLARELKKLSPFRRQPRIQLAPKSTHLFEVGLQGKEIALGERNPLLEQVADAFNKDLPGWEGAVRAIVLGIISELAAEQGDSCHDHVGHLTEALRK